MLVERKILSTASKSVIRLPSGIPFEGTEEEPEFSAKLEDQFVLVVCTLEVRKNHKVLLTAASEAIRLGEFFPQLVFVGAKGWGYEEIRRDIEVNEQLKLKVMHESGVSDSQLRWLYRNCTLVAYPSFVEGLGLPIIEAKQFGKRVLASSAEVFREILDEADVTISPNDAMEWKIQIQQKCVEKTSPKVMDGTLNSWDQVIDDVINSIN
jgi:glycosyltransferase involved in cell wall biosynthesis